VPKGMLYLDDVQLRNPEGFLLENMASVERINVKVNVKSMLLQQPLIVHHVEVENALVNVIRNEAGEINVNSLKGPRAEEAPEQPEPVPPPDAPPEKVPEPGKIPPKPKPEKPLPELLFERILCNATVRYIDFKLDQLDIALQLQAKAVNLSTLSDPEAGWGAAQITGSLGNDHNSYKTELNLRLAPVRSVDQLSFDLTGRIMEIDPRSLESLWKRAGIRPAPFGIEPEFHSRNHAFVNSQVSVSMKEVALEDKLSRKLGGMGTVETLSLTVPITGTLDRPRGDFQSALMSAIGKNAGSLLNAWIKGQAGKYGVETAEVPTTVDAAVDVLGEAVKEIGESETVKKVLKDLADGEPSATNAPPPISSDTAVEILGEHIEEIGENEELKKELKNLGKWLFGE
ncbi:AsmA family protein, partial [Pontiella sp.]|uniref:AsmA family protein n=1 Tax=Pontiella sp. TaxID=2837462 RepID=UPI0035661980